jgi:Tol biopolymer transport system component
MIHRRSLVPIGIFLLIVVLGGGLWSLRPQVVFFAPELDAINQSDTAAITITFNRMMRPQSVESRLTITPAIEGAFEWEGRTLRFIPTDSWEGGEIVSVQLARGAQSRWLLPTLQSTAWQFTVARTRLAFLWPLDGPTDLYALDPLGGKSEQLTDQGAVLDFDVDESTGLIYFSASNTEGGSDLYRYDWRLSETSMALPCGAHSCADVAAAPGGDWLAYTRVEDRAGALPAIWTLNSMDGSTRQVSPRGHEALLPVWSSQGVLAFYDYADLEFVFYEPVSGERITWANRTGATGSWAPNGVNFVAPESFEVVTDTLRGPSGELENEEVGDAELSPIVVFSTHLLSFNLVNQRAVDLSIGDQVEDLSPSFSPDGLQIAFGRRLIDPAISAGGRQLWLMGRDGAAPTAITERPTFKYNQFVWHPFENQVAFVRFDNVALTAPPEIWLLDLGTRNGFRLVIGAFSPQWIP